MRLRSTPKSAFTVFGRPPAPRVHHNPVRCTAELAREFNVNINVLRGLLSMHPQAPKPQFRMTNNNSSKTYYDHAKVQKWWKRYGAQKAAAHEHT